MTLFQQLKSLICSPDGSLDEARIIAISGFIIFFYKTIVYPGTFDFQNWAIGMTALMAGLGAMLGFRKDN